MSDAVTAALQEEIGRLKAELDQYQARHQEFQRAVKQAREIIHDANQPLTTLMGNVELMMLRAEPDDPARPKLQVMVDQCERLRQRTAELGELIRNQDDDIRGS